MKNRYVLTGASWVTGAFNRVSKAAVEVSQKTKEKVENAEQQEKRQVEDQYAQVLSEPSKAAAAASEQQSSKPGPAPAQGLILWFASSVYIYLVETPADHFQNIVYLFFSQIGCEWTIGLTSYMDQFAI